MVKNYMITMPRENGNALKLLKYINTNDIHKWVIGLEVGKSGYQHWQCRIKAREDFCEWTKVKHPITGEQMSIGTGWIQRNLPTAHVEECSDVWDYETKEGRYIASWDTMEIRRQRFGKPRWYQECALETLRRTNDREIVVWVDETGNVGKTWLNGFLFETQQAYYLPPYLTSIQSMIQTLASMVIEDRKAGNPPKPYVIIDIPRSWKWSTDLYVAIEAIKDGLILDPRYSARPINIRGIKVMVLTNTQPKMDKLSADRWVPFTIGLTL